MKSTPFTIIPALDLFPNLRPPHKTFAFHQILVLIITFIAYASFHASRKPPSIVKSVLGPTTSTQSNSTSIGSGWSPFNGPRGTHRLGELDLAFLSSYAMGMYFAGHIGDRIDLRLFLVFGMLGSGICTIIFGSGYFFKIHELGFFVAVQIVCGLFQSIGWPCVVAIVGNWFGKEKRGLIMGIWNSHTSVGNIIGSVIASSVLEFGWGWSFLIPGTMVIFAGVFVFFFLVVRPENLGYELTEKETEMNIPASSVDRNVAGDIEKVGLPNIPVGPVDRNVDEDIEKAGLLNFPASPVDRSAAGDVEKAGLLNIPVSPGDKNDAGDIEKTGLLTGEDLNSMAAIGFLEAWRLPGVAPFAFCLFFSKLVAYTFLYWLPFYIQHTAVAGVHFSHKTAGILSTIFDIGGVFGGILAGFISDVIQARALTSISFLSLSIPALVLYRGFGNISMITNISLMFLSGLLINGPYALITTAVAADLGTQSLIKGNSRALATVSAIIDGTGSVGAAIGPLLAGYISTRGWNSVFFMLILSIFFGSLFLLRLARSEIKERSRQGNWFRSSPGSH